MTNNHGTIATVPINEFISLLEFKLITLKEAKEKDNSWNYNIEELETEINKIKSFISLM